MWHGPANRDYLVLASREVSPTALRIASSFESVSRSIALVLSLGGCAVLLGWLFDISTLKRVHAGLATMKANTAVCFALAGISLWLLNKGREDEIARGYARVPAVIIVLISLMTLSEYVFGWELGIDQLLFEDSEAIAPSLPGRMAPATALNFALLGTALSLLDVNRCRWFAQALVLVAAFFSGLALLGYLDQISSLYSVSAFSSVSIHTAVLFQLLALGILFARPQTGLMAAVSSDTTGGIMVRRLVPFFLALVVTLGWLRLLGQRSGLYDTEFGLGLLVVTMTVIFSAVILLVGRRISRIDARRRLAEEALRASEERYRLLFESNPHPMWVYDVETLAFLAVNNAAVEHYGYSAEEFLAMTIKEIRPPEEIPVVVEAVGALSHAATSKVFRTHRKKDGTLIDVEGASRELTIEGRRARLVLATDITERKRLEEQLRQSQKMEAIGRLAGGVAHDFNNLLTAIIGYADLMLNRAGSDEVTRRDVEEIRTAGNRAASLTRQLLAFSRKQMLRPKVLELNEVVTNIDNLLRRLIGEDVDLLTVSGAGLGHIRADPGQVEQIILNLAVNARDAMPGGGKLTIETANVDLDESYASIHPDVTPGPYVMLALSDTGHGMDAETRSHLFEPFFTTKELGKGTGLGLSTVYGIVKQSGGHIWVYSEPGKGAAFKVYFPRIDEAAEVFVARASSLESLRGSESILLVEDDDSVRKLTRLVLEESGYTVLEAANGAQALTVAKQYAPEISLLVTDVVMPATSGKDLAAQFEALLPNLRVLYISGYTENAVVHHGVIAKGLAFLQKPFTPEALLQKVRALLDEPAPDVESFEF